MVDLALIENDGSSNAQLFIIEFNRAFAFKLENEMA